MLQRKPEMQEEMQILWRWFTGSYSGLNQKKRWENSGQRNTKDESLTSTFVYYPCDSLKKISTMT